MFTRHVVVAVIIYTISLSGQVIAADAPALVAEAGLQAPVTGTLDRAAIEERIKAVKDEMRAMHTKARQGWKAKTDLDAVLAKIAASTNAADVEITKLQAEIKDLKTKLAAANQEYESKLEANPEFKAAKNVIKGQTEETIQMQQRMRDLAKEQMELMEKLRAMKSDKGAGEQPNDAKSGAPARTVLPQTGP